MENFKEFAAKRVAIGIFCAVLIVWGVFWVLKEPGKKPAERPQAASAPQTAGGVTGQGHDPGAPQTVSPVKTARMTTVNDIKERRVPAINADITAWEGLDTLKREFGNLDRLREFYVTDKEGVLVGKSTLVRLMAVGDEVKIREFMDKNPMSVSADMKIESVSELLASHHESQLPIVDARGQLMGLVSSSAILSAMQKDASKPALETQPEAEKQAHAALPEASEGAAGHTADSKNAMTQEKEATHSTVKTLVSNPSTPDTAHPSADAHTTAASPEPAAAPTAAKGHETAASSGHGQEAEGAMHAWPPPTPRIHGMAFSDAVIDPMSYELDGRFWGWRPNDIFYLGDNVKNYQLGVLEATRRVSVVFRENLSRTGTMSAYDPGIEKATNTLMIMPTSYWFPSAEGEYTKAMEEIRKYRDRLETGRAGFYTRTDSLIPLLEALELLLGSIEENLVKKTEKGGAPITAFTADGYFYYAQGAVSVMNKVLYAVAIDFWPIIESRKVTDVLQDAIESCHHSLQINPWFITDSDPSGILANHRANLAAPVGHARFFVGVLVKALST